MARPRIGINLDLEPGMRTLGDQRLFTLNPDYVHCVARSGGIPIVLPALRLDQADYEETVRAQLAGLDGLVLIGGNDMDPSTFGQPPHPRIELLDPQRDRYDLVLVHAALALGLPVLGICGGMQLINVALGGTLHQHLPATEGAAFATLCPVHRDQHGVERTHDVTIAPGSLARRWAGCDRLTTNSRHHQAVDRLGTGLRASAWGPDHVIEAIEPTAGNDPADDEVRFVLGVQWHPEEMANEGPQRRFFDGLIAAAARRRFEPPRVRLVDGA